MCSTPVLILTSHLKVVLYFRESRFEPFSSIFSVMKVSCCNYFDCNLLANNFRAVFKMSV